MESGGHAGSLLQQRRIRRQLAVSFLLFFFWSRHGGVIQLFRDFFLLFAYFFQNSCQLSVILALAKSFDLLAHVFIYSILESRVACARSFMRLFVAFVFFLALSAFVASDDAQMPFGGVARTPIRPNEHIVKALRKAVGSRVLRRLPDHIIISTLCRSYSKSCPPEFVDFLEKELRDAVGDEEADEIIREASLAADDKPYGRRGDPDVSTACRKFGKCSTTTETENSAASGNNADEADVSKKLESRDSFDKRTDHYSVDDQVRLETLRQVRALKQRKLDDLVELQVLHGNQCFNINVQAQICEAHTLLLKLIESSLVRYDMWRLVYIAAIPALATLAVLVWIFLPDELDGEHVEFLNCGIAEEAVYRFRLLDSLYENSALIVALRTRATLSMMCVLAVGGSIWSLPGLLENTWFEFMCSFFVPVEWMRLGVVVLSVAYLSSTIIFPARQCFQAWQEMFAVDDQVEEIHRRLFSEVMRDREQRGQRAHAALLLASSNPAGGSELVPPALLEQRGQ